jgi:hypothetical protein
MQESEASVELTSIPLPDKLIFEFTGHVLPNAIAFGNYKNLMIIAVGTTGGVLQVFTGDNLAARTTVRDLGTISTVNFVHLPMYAGNCLMACSLEGKCYVISLEHWDLPEEFGEEAIPEFTNDMLPNISCCLVDDLDGDLRIELLASSTDGVIGVYKYANENPGWGLIRLWSLSFNVTALSVAWIDSKPTIMMSDNEGNFRFFQLGIETPERAQSRNILTERVGIPYGYTLLSSGGDVNSVAAVNFQGKLAYIKNLSFDTRNFEGTVVIECKLGRMPVFVDKLRFSESREEVIVVGTSDGCVLFVSADGVSNIYRYEETIQAFRVGHYSYRGSDRAVLAVVANCGKLVLFPTVKFLDNKLTDFIQKAQEDIEELKKVINDGSSTTADLLRKYIYMPLS